MREIKFRGKRVDNGEWVEGDLHKNVDFTKAHIHPIGERIKSFDVIPETVGQYITEIDKHDKGICEGDLVTWFINGHEKTGPVVYEKGAFWIGKDVNSGIEVCNDWYRGEYEIIGNVHDKKGEPENLATLSATRLSKAIGAGGTLKALDDLGVVIKDKDVENRDKEGE